MYYVVEKLGQGTLWYWNKRIDGGHIQYELRMSIEYVKLKTNALSLIDILLKLHFTICYIQNTYKYLYHSETEHTVMTRLKILLWL